MVRQPFYVRPKTYIDPDLVFDSSDTFLYRQKGQLKLDNTIVEEFLPWLVKQVLADQFPDNGLILGPATTLSHIQFDSDLANVTAGGGINIRTKDQDFTIARPLFLRASHRQECERPVEIETHLAYVAAEIKTNLDKRCSKRLLRRPAT